MSEIELNPTVIVFAGINGAGKTTASRSLSVRNLFELYIPVVTGWKVYDNSATGWPRLLAKGKRDQPEVVIDSTRWALVRGSAANG